MTVTDDPIKLFIILQYFHQIPNENAAIAALSLYLFISLVTLAITVKTRTWFMLCVPISGFLEMFGYACRIIVLHTAGYAAYVAMQALLIVTPVLLALVDYVCVGKLMMLGKTQNMPIKPAWVALFFLSSDVLCLMLQGSGGGLCANVDPKVRDTGTKLLIAGLFLQLFFFTCFTILTVYVHRKREFGLRDQKKLKPVFFALYATIGLMFARNIFRVVEFLDGWSGYLATHEEYLYGFDFALIYLCFIVFSVYHFGFYLTPATVGLPQNATVPIDEDGRPSKSNLSDNSKPAETELPIGGRDSPLKWQVQTSVEQV